MRKRRRLSVGTSPGCAIVALPVGIFLALIFAFLAWMAVDQTRRFVTGGDFGLGTVFAFAVLAVIFGVVLYLVGALAWIYLRSHRPGPGGCHGGGEQAT